MNWTSGLLTGYGLYDQLDRYSDISKAAVEGTNQLAQDALSGSQFKPFTVRTATGTAQAGADGSLTLNASPEMQQFSSGLFDAAGDQFYRASLPTQNREQAVYDRIRAAQRPEEQRAQTAMDARLQGQGRAGIRSAQYGGSPEQLAYAKAVEEAKNNASLMAIQQAQSEQQQDANIGGMFLEAGYLPQSQLLNAFNPSLSLANMAQAGQLGGQSLASQLGLSGLQTALNADVARGNLVGNAIGNVARGISGTDFDPVGDIADWIGGLFT